MDLEQNNVSKTDTSGCKLIQVDLFVFKLCY